MMTQNPERETGGQMCNKEEGAIRCHLTNVNVINATRKLNEKILTLTDRTIILESGSAFNLLKNKELLANIQEANGTMSMMTNTGHHVMKEEGTVPGLDTKVWHDPKSEANTFGLIVVGSSKRFLEPLSVLLPNSHGGCWNELFFKRQRFPQGRLPDSTTVALTD